MLDKTLFYQFLPKLTKMMRNRSIQQKDTAKNENTDIGINQLKKKRAIQWMTLSVINFLSVVVFNDEGFIEFLQEVLRMYLSCYPCLHQRMLV